MLQNLAMFLSMLVAWLIPDNPRTLKNHLKREKALLLELLLSEEAEKQNLQSQRPANINITINTPEDETINQDCVIELQSQAAKMLQSLDRESKDQMPGEELEITTSEMLNPDRTSSPETLLSLHSTHPVTSKHQTNQGCQVKTDFASIYHDFNLKGPLLRDPNTKSRSRCRTLPPRPREEQPGNRSNRASHSTSFVHFGEKIPPSHSEILRNIPSVSLWPPSKRDFSSNPKFILSTELSDSQLSVRSCLPSNTEHPVSQFQALLSSSLEQKIASSQPSVTYSASKPEVLPRPPSRQELSGSQAALPRPPSKSELMGNATKGLPLQDPNIRAKFRCKTLPPRHRPPDDRESSTRASHSTSFTHISQNTSSIANETMPDAPV